MPEGVGYGPQNTASIGEDIHVIGSHAYALSGTFPSTNVSQNMLDFQTGNYIFVGRIYCNGAVDVGTVDAGVVNAFTIEMNGITIALVKSETGSERQYAAWNDIIIPPFTQFTVKVIASGNNTAFLTTAVMTGRIYK
jgi:hypothetical protein